MKLATIRTTRGDVPAVVDGDDVVDLSIAAPSLPSTMVEILAGGADALAAAAAGVASGKGRSKLADAKLAAPIPRPPQVLRHRPQLRRPHRRDRAWRPPKYPVFFNKQSHLRRRARTTTSTCRGSPTCSTTRASSRFVIGTRCRARPAARRAHEVIAGYTITNDVSVRD